jgi:glutamate---cysteine ligase / carboxylate-amine ligase
MKENAPLASPGSPASPALRAFKGFGIELEYMIVDRDTLSVLPIADRLLREEPGSQGNDVHRGVLGWSNELVLHVIEVKNPRPIASLSMLPEAFHDEVQHINKRLARHQACLMPGAMHPWMNPETDTRLWPHDNNAIYNAYDRIFNTRSHGWANLQSMHINLPFTGDEEFARLHAAIRLVLPILPALAASSPIADGEVKEWADYRMRVYWDNATQIPSISGMVVPETITSKEAYEHRILQPMFRDIAPLDPEGVLQEEWLNSRGAIARFDRSAIEIRVVDTQECPRADIAVATAACAIVRSLFRERTASLLEQQEMTTAGLAKVLEACIRDGEETVIDHAGYLRLLGYPGERCRAKELWQFLVEAMHADDPVHMAIWNEPLRVILKHGTLSTRIRKAVGNNPSRARLKTVYGELCACLEQNRMFIPQ